MPPEDASPAAPADIGAPAPTDEELVLLCRGGDRDAWDRLIDRFSRYVWAIAVQGYRLSATDAEDVFQDVFARTYQHLGSLRRDDAIRPWIGQLTRRLAIDRLRAADRERVTDVLVETAETDPALERLAEALEVRTALEGLPGHCQQILDRFFARDESYATIAAAFEIPAGTVASRISRCLGKLRQALEGRELGAAT